MKTLDKWDNLMIRACKGNGDTKRRLIKIWATRCGLKKKYVEKEPIQIIYHLLSLLDGRKSGMTFSEWVHILEESNPNSFRNNLWGVKTFEECVFNIVISTIALTNVNEWDNYISPAFFKNAE